MSKYHKEMQLVTTKVFKCGKKCPAWCPPYKDMNDNDVGYPKCAYMNRKITKEDLEFTKFPLWCKLDDEE